MDRPLRKSGKLGASLVALALITVTSVSCSKDEEPSSSTPGATRGLRRLTHREYDNVVRDLLGDDSRPAQAFGSEVYGNGFDNGSRGLVVLGPEYLAFRNAAETLAARAVQDPKRLVGDCDPSADEHACVEAFLSGFAPRAYRRPLSQGEADRLRGVYQAGAANGGFVSGLRLMLEAVLQAPAFLYREEIGVPDPSLPPGVVRLTGWELASSLSFLITGSMPDDALFQAVRDGRLATAGDIRREATRLAATPAGQATLRVFLGQWFGTDVLGTMTKDAVVYPGFTREVASAMSADVDRFFGRVASGTGSLHELFTSRGSSFDAPLAPIYGVPAGTDVTLPPERAGVLTRAGFLAAHADVDSSGPILRGVFLLNAILCRPPPARPPNVPPAPTQAQASKDGMTTRERFDAHLSNAGCAGCHRTIDGVGFGFEQFDGIGAFRTTENGKPVDASGELVGTDVDGPFVGVAALSDRLANSPEVVDCFARHAYRFAMGHDESGPDDGLLVAMKRPLSSDARMSDAFVTLAVQPGFARRTSVGGGK